MIRAVLIDLDGVVRRWPSTVVDDRIREAMFEPVLLRRAVTGAITDDEWRVEVARRLGDADVVRAWSASIGEVDEDVLAIVTELRKVVPVALVSNATTRLEADLDALGMSDAFDLVVNSSRVGAAKPDEAIFAWAAGRLGVALEECVFVDDTRGHVDGAQRLGLRTIHFTDATSLRSALGSYGLLAEPGSRLELLIRRAHPDEARELAELHSRTELDAYREIFPADAPPPTIDEHRRRWTQTLLERTAFVAVVDNEIVGVVVVGADVMEPSTGHLSRFYVAPERSGRGIGTRLYQTCMRELAELGFAEATLWVLERNVRARRWYERLGWTTTGERKEVYAPSGVIDLRYRLTSF